MLYDGRQALTVTLTDQATAVVLDFMNPQRAGPFPYAATLSSLSAPRITILSAPSGTSEGEQRAFVGEREPHHILLVRLWRVFGEPVGQDQTAVLRLEPAAPVRR